MNSSGIKRGLAITAVSALAITGLPALAGSASAAPLATPGSSSVVLETQTTGAASTKNDGVNTTVHLVATAGANVTQVRFQYKVGSTGIANTIDTVGRANGGFSKEWTPPTNILGSAGVIIEAVGITAAGDIAPVDGTSRRTVALATGLETGTDAINIANPAGSELGVFEQPTDLVTGYPAEHRDDVVAVTGTTSSTAAPVLSSPTGTGTRAAQPAAIISSETGPARTFSGVVSLGQYAWSTPDTTVAPPATPADEAVIVATAGSDDAELVKLYKQQITSITAKAGAPVADATKGSATVTVRDQKGNPIAGARVSRTGTDGTTAAGTAQYTNGLGEATFGSLTATPAGTSYKFHVDADGAEGYQSSKDRQTAETLVRSYVAAPTTLTATSADGGAFDFNEYAPGDISVTTKDQEGATVNPDVAGQWTIKAFDTRVATRTVAAEINKATGAVTFPPTGGEVAGTYTLNTWINKDGNPEQGDGDLSAKPLTFSAGQARVIWGSTAAQAAPGSTLKQNGTLVLDDGKTALGTREATVVFTKTTGGDAKFAPTADQPAGTTRTSDTEATVKTAADGTFSVAVTDPAAAAPTPQAAELGGKLDIKAGSVFEFEGDELTIDFVNLAGSDFLVTGKALIDDGVSATNDATPGRPVSYTLTLRNAAKQPLKNATVDLSLDHGFFTTYAATEADLSPATSPTVGGQFGNWKDLTNKQTLTTDANGQVKVTVAIGRDTGFDDNGAVTATLTAKSGSVTQTEAIEFSSANALNPKSATVDFAKGEAASLPNAQVNSTVKLDVFVKDQFDNLTALPVTVTGKSDAAEVITSNFEGAPAIVVTRAAAAAQTIRVAVNATTTIWKDKTPATPAVEGERDTANTATKALSDSETINWYAINYATSNYSISSTATGAQVPGKTVIVTYKALDQNGNPIKGAKVDFFQAGPGDERAQEKDATTDDNGVATYTFAGGKEGTATVTAVLKQGNNSVADSTKETKIVFAGPVVVTPPPVVTPPAPAPAPAPAPSLIKIIAKMIGSNNGSSADKVTVNAPSHAKGAAVRLYRVVKGKRILAGTSRLNASGDKTFTVRDRNGKSKTRYIAVVDATSKTKADTTNSKNLK